MSTNEMSSHHFGDIQALVKKVNEEMLQDLMECPHEFLAVSAYDTAWLSMIQDPDKKDGESAQPMFGGCLNWILNNQTEEGFWGECDVHGNPTIESLTATLACIIALNRWSVGKTNIGKGLVYVEKNAEKFIGNSCDGHCPRWFAIIFPAMIEIAHSIGLCLVFTSKLRVAVTEIFYKRQQILHSEKLVEREEYGYPLLSYLEALPSTYEINEEDLVKQLSDDGSLFQSPAATAKFFMLTKNKKSLSYLKSLIHHSSNYGVLPVHPMDEELIKLCMVNQLQRFGLAEHFKDEIEIILEQVYRSYKNQEPKVIAMTSVAMQLYKDALAFRTLRMGRYTVSPRMFCWFLNDEKLQNHIEKNCQSFSTAMLHVYGATDLMFVGEYEVEDARSFSKNLLHKVLQIASPSQFNFDGAIPNFHAMIEDELSCPWIARLDHLEHRMWIEQKDSNACWMGKASFHRLSNIQNNKLIQLAMTNFEFRQSIYKHELDHHLKGWTRKWGFDNMRFAREKTTYCYFTIAASTTLAHNSIVRTIVAKAAILITVADDFFDMKGSLHDLQILTDKVQRWDSNGLSGHSKKIFNALDDFVTDFAAKYFQYKGIDITNHVRDLWGEAFMSWLKEATWSKTGLVPSMSEYLQTGMISITAHTLVLSAACFLDPSLPNQIIKSFSHEYQTLTKLLMLICRLLNDTQSYEKEQKQGKLNSVLLHMIENPEVNLEDSIAYVKDIIDKKSKELLEHVLMDDLSNMPKSCKHLHLSIFKVFQMFFHSCNLYDSDSNNDMLQDIQKTIYIPLAVKASKSWKHEPLPQLPHHVSSGPKEDYKLTINSKFALPFKQYKNSRRNLVALHQISKPPLQVLTYNNKLFSPKNLNTFSLL